MNWIIQPGGGLFKELQTVHWVEVKDYGFACIVETFCCPLTHIPGRIVLAAGHTRRKLLDVVREAGNDARDLVTCVCIHIPKGTLK